MNKKTLDRIKAKWEIDSYKINFKKRGRYHMYDRIR